MTESPVNCLYKRDAIPTQMRYSLKLKNKDLSGYTERIVVYIDQKRVGTQAFAEEKNSKPM